ncbi:MAG: hypothetical protein ACFFCZ_30420 [Promethearchaeota archaeon]
MSDLEEVIVAFQLVNKYEEYTLIKALGIILMIFGVAHFFYSWVTNTIIFQFFFIQKTIIAIVVLVILVLFTVYLYFSLRKTEIKDNELFSSRFTYFGLALVVLYSLTFIVDLLFYSLSIDIPSLVASLVRSRGSVFLLSLIFNILFYCKDGIGVFFMYFILRRGIKSSEFEELILLSFVSLITSIAIYVLAITSIFFLFFFSFFIVLFLIATLSYSGAFIISGLYAIRKAIRVLQSENKSILRQHYD